MQFKYLPNMLSFSRLLIAPFFILFMLKNTFYYKIYSILFFSLGSLSDFLDGYLARKYNNVSTLGKYIDPLADKVLIFSSFYILYLFYPEVVQSWMILIIFFRDVFTMFLRTYLINNKIIFETSFTARIKTLFQIIVIHIFLMFHIYNPGLILHHNFFNILILSTVLLTVISTFPYFRFFTINESN
tara:strand:- start:529 stop:1086 length:558 start_codon:yes stop_codon:yes gene_type:complete